MTKKNKSKDENAFEFRIQFHAKVDQSIDSLKFRNIIFKALSNIADFKDISFDIMVISMHLNPWDVDQIVLDHLLYPERQK